MGFLIDPYRFAPPLAPLEVIITVTGAGSTTVPAGYNRVTIETWGAGGAGGFGPNSTADWAAGGGGGAYSRTDALPVTAGQTIHYLVGAGGPRRTTEGLGDSGGDTWVNITSNAAPSVRDDGALAKGGAGGLGRGGTVSPSFGFVPGAAGGSAAASVGDVKFSGGNSGTTGYFRMDKTGGGGSGGPNGAGLPSPGNPTDASPAPAAFGGAGNGGLAPGGEQTNNNGGQLGASTLDGGGGGAGDNNAGTTNCDGGSPGGGGGGSSLIVNAHGAAGGRGQVRLTFSL